ncbi:MAG: GGDEF domain-containing phosphodiesterase, partial [Thiovulaceae bacterium]|nr:GGDEF domain-containing phosphodiesterase [Sulfurimonadaceae bacterium]
SSFKNYIDIEGHSIHLTFSAGISIYPQDTQDANALIENSNEALHSAKKSGKNTFEFYTKDMAEKTYENLSMVSKLKNSLQNKELQIYFQPQVDLKTKQIMGCEALLRWHHKDLGNVSPEIFIPIAEKQGLIIELGNFVLEESFKKYAKWFEKNLNPGILSVNVSALQIKNDSFISHLKKLIKKYEFNVKNLEIELTESQLMQNAESSIEVLKQISELGIKIAIDDFGTGYSSLSYLKKLPIDVLKIDRSFIKDIPEDNNDAEVTKAIIAIAKSLKLLTVAEGVETKEQLTFLEKYECNIIQGYYYYKPMSEEDFESLLNINN